VIEAVFREERGRVLAALISVLGDVDLAEDALQEALIVAMGKWDVVSRHEQPLYWVRKTAWHKLLNLQSRQRWKDQVPLDEIPERLETEPSESEGFVPLSADLSLTPQLALFGAPGGAPAPMPSFPSAVEPPPAQTEMPAYQRRALLRDKRHRLVTDLRHPDGRTQAEINAWVNKRAGITRVQDASIEQLERSIALLLDELTARR